MDCLSDCIRNSSKAPRTPAFSQRESWVVLAVKTCVESGWCTLAHKVALFLQKNLRIKEMRKWPRING